jgi:hypothetical protein
MPGGATGKNNGANLNENLNETGAQPGETAERDNCGQGRADLPNLRLRTSPLLAVRAGLPALTLRVPALVSRPVTEWAMSARPKRFRRADQPAKKTVQIR